MTEELIKFIVDLGSIGAICYIVFMFVRYISAQDKLNSEERIETHRQMCETFTELSKRDKED